MNASQPIIELPDNVDAENDAFDTPVRAAKTSIETRPTITTFTVLRRYANRFEVHLHGLDRVVMVRRESGQNAKVAVRRFLNGGTAL